jgi:hypothetical protein
LSDGTHDRSHIPSVERGAASCIEDTACSKTFAWARQFDWLYVPREVALFVIRPPTERHTEDESRLWSKTTARKLDTIWLFVLGNQKTVARSSS